jgi:Ca-activated chloride channel family protein
MKKNPAIFFKLFLAALMLCTALVPAEVHAQESKKTRILFLLDLSGSMWGVMKDGKRKVDVAKSILIRLSDSLDKIPNVEMALRCYGHTAKRNVQDCKDTRLEVPFSENNSQQIKDRIGQLNPSGTTPIAYSLSQAAGDFPNTYAKNIIVLITDGLEECGGDPCAVSQALQASHVIIRPFIIGLGMDQDYSKYFDCVGRYYSAETETDLRNVLSTVVTQALNNTTMQVNLNDITGKPTETNVAMTFYNAKNGEEVKDVYHTMNSFGRPDTFNMDPLVKYNLEVHTTPPVYKNDIALKPSSHTIINVDAPQGTLDLKVNTIDYFSLKAIVKKQGQNDIVNVQDFNTTHKYIVGSYDLEVLTLPRTIINNVQIQQSKSYSIEIPQAGKLTLSYKKVVIASLYVLRNNHEEWVIDLQGSDITSKDLYYLQPGNYKIVYRPKDSYQTIDSREKEFKIASGQYTDLTID